MARQKSRLNRQVNAPAALVSGRIDTLVQGVSQQPPHLRLPGQGAEQLNGWSSPVTGLTKRRPTRFASKLHSQPLDDFYLETMAVSADERYLLMLHNDGTNVRLTMLRDGKPVHLDVHGTGLSLFNTDPTAPWGQGISGSNTSYLWNSSNLFNSYVLINNGPVGFLLNRNKPTGMKSDLSPAQKNEALIFVQGVTYEITYTVSLDGTELPAYTTPKATDTANKISTELVAKELASRINAVSGFTATQLNSVVKVVKTGDAPFKISVKDDRANTLARVFKESTASFTGLPTEGFNDFMLKIEGNAATAKDDAWVKFLTYDKSASGEGSWQETVKPGIKYRLDWDTMPLMVYRKERDVIFIGPMDGAKRTLTVNGVTHEFKFPAWGDRTAGDEESVPNPGFLGYPIRDHVLFRSRYLVVGGQSCDLSEVDQVWNFFGDTAAQTLDTDPISIRVVSEAVDDLQWVLPVDESVLLFSSEAQFQLRPADADVLTPRTALALRLSAVEMNPQIRPKLAGPNIVFSTNENGYTGFREYQYFDTQQRRVGLNLGGSLNIALNVPKYIPGLAKLWDVGENEDYFVCNTPVDERVLYVHKYLWQQGENNIAKQQSSWSQWRLDSPVKWMRFYDSRLWLVSREPDGLYLTSIRQEEVNKEQSDYYLDRLVFYPECNADANPANDIKAAYDSITNTTTFTLPYQMSGPTDVVVRYDNPKGRALTLAQASTGHTLTCRHRGDWRNAKLAIGARYLFRYEFTPAYVPAADQARQRTLGLLSGRLQVATWQIHHANTARYDVVVKRQNRERDSRHEFWARRLNVERNRLDTEQSVLETGNMRVPVCSQNTHCRVFVESDSWLPVTLSGATWEGNYSDRSRRLN